MDCLVAQKINSAIADMCPECRRILNKTYRTGCSRAHLDTTVGTEANKVLVCFADGKMKKSLRVEYRLGGSYKCIDNCLASDFRRTRAISMPAHTIDHDQNHGFGVSRDFHPILIFLTTAYQAQFCVFKLQQITPGHMRKCECGYRIKQFRG